MVPVRIAILRKRFEPILGVAALAATSTLFSPVGLAQQSGEAVVGALEEVIVTARKREETVQDAPLSIKAFTTAQIEERGVESIADLSKFAPGLTYNQGTSRFASDFSIRGMTQISAPGDNRRDLVTVFIDGVPYIGSPAGIGSEDLQRVEVIRGPQSALFGRATFGGAISLITATPGDEFKARASVTAADYGDRRVSLGVEGPLIEGKLAGRVIVDASDFDGFYRNAFGGRLGESEQRYYAASLALTPTEDISIRLRYGKRDDEDGPAATTLIARWPDHNCGPFPGFTARPLTGLPPGFTLAQARRAFCGELRAPNGSVGINTILPTASIGRVAFDEHKLELTHELAAMIADWSMFDGHVLTAIASKQDQRTQVLNDFERAPEDRYQGFAITDQSQDSYEFRFASPADRRFSWMIGLSRLDADFATGGGFINGALFGPAAGGPPLPLNITRSASQTDSVFGSVQFDITDQLNVSLEARRQEDTITSGVGSVTQFDIVTKATLPRFLVRYELTDALNVYANYGEGNQPTQGYSVFFQLTPAQQQVALQNGVSSQAPEAEVKNYEIGMKYREPGGRWYLNASLYYLEWIGRQGLRNLQIDLNGDGQITLLPAPSGEVFNAVPFAAGDSNTRGLEIDGAVSLTDALQAGGSVSYADTKITKALNEPVPLRLFGVTDSAGKKFPLVPEWSSALFAQYERSINESSRWFVRGDATYIGKRYDNIVNLAYVPDQWRANLRAGWRAENWDVTAWVNNVFDDDTLEASRYNSDSAADPFFFQLVSSEAVLPNKRQFGVTVTFRF